LGRQRPSAWMVAHQGGLFYLLVNTTEIVGLLLTRTTRWAVCYTVAFFVALDLKVGRHFSGGN
jgi:hypothetical protein